MISTDARLLEYCQWLRGALVIALDTEFVSESRYRPELCLVQVAARHRDEPGKTRLTVIDPLKVRTVLPFWEVVSSGTHETIVHAGREELSFCLEAVGKLPTGLFDVQIAAGLVGLEYPAGYVNLTTRLLDTNPGKGETRTDWRHRPLSEHQIEYALNDVRYLEPLRDRLHEKLVKLNRLPWIAEEMEAWQAEVVAYTGQSQWRRLAGCSSMNRRELAIVREIWEWRDEEARTRNKPMRRILRDDLVVELAKRRTADEKRILALRDFQRRDYRTAVPDLSKCIARALALPDAECPEVMRREVGSNRAVLGQFLAAALGTICRRLELSPGLVGGPNDVRELVAYRLGELPSLSPSPSLAIGWRAEVVGKLLDDLMDGKLAVRVFDPREEQPLAFENVSPKSGENRPSR